MRGHFLFATAGALLCSTALAGFSPKVLSTFEGQILFSGDVLTAKASDVETIAHLKKMSVTSVTCATSPDDSPATMVNLTAFLKAKPAGDLKLVIAETSAPSKPGHKQSVPLTADPNALTIETAIEISADDVVGPKLKLTLEQGVPVKVIASGTLDAPCLKKSASAPKAQPAAKPKAP
jgi:hypothetical protein